MVPLHVCHATHVGLYVYVCVSMYVCVCVVDRVSDTKWERMGPPFMIHIGLLIGSLMILSLISICNFYLNWSMTWLLSLFMCLWLLSLMYIQTNNK